MNWSIVTIKTAPLVVVDYLMGFINWILRRLFYYQDELIAYRDELLIYKDEMIDNLAGVVPFFQFLFFYFLITRLRWLDLIIVLVFYINLFK
jgi:hypothetical protein